MRLYFRFAFERAKLHFVNLSVKFEHWYLKFEFIGVLRHMQRYFIHIYDSTDVQADWRRSCTYGLAPNAIDTSHASLTCPSCTDTGPPILYGDSDTAPIIRL